MFLHFLSKSSGPMSLRPVEKTTKSEKVESRRATGSRPLAAESLRSASSGLPRPRLGVFGLAKLAKMRIQASPDHEMGKVRFPEFEIQ